VRNTQSVDYLECFAYVDGNDVVHNGQMSDTRLFTARTDISRKAAIARYRGVAELQ
jgi:hypothetical protein